MTKLEEIGKPDDIPQDVWDTADAVGEAIHGKHVRGFISWPLMSESGVKPQIIVARAIMAEREACAQVVSDQVKLLNPGWSWLAPVVVAIRNRGAAAHG